VDQVNEKEADGGECERYKNRSRRRRKIEGKRTEG
jgi:hypothetical protein